MNLSEINAVENIIDNCTDNYNRSIRNKLYEIDDILDEFEFTSFGIGGEINESQRSIKEQNNNLNDFRESVSIYNKEVIEMENNTAGKLKRIARIGKGSEVQIGDNTSIEFIPTFSWSAQYIPGQIVKIKGTDGKWYIGTAQIDELVGTGGYRKFKFVPNKLNDVDVSEKENFIEYLKSRGNGIIAGIEHYSTGCRNALDYIGENWLGLDYDRPCIDNPNVTMRDQVNKANYDDARDYNRLRNNSQYKSVFDNTSKNAEKTLNTIDIVLAIHGIKNIAVGSANYLRANKTYIQANVETVKNNANILNEAISNVNKRPRGMVLGADGGNIDSYIRDVNKEYKELKNVE